MPRVLSRADDQLALWNLEYGVLMKFAYVAGWRPAGTLQPDRWEERLDPQGVPRRWFSMNYFSRLGQTVTQPDAQALAGALEAALPDVPRHDALGHKVSVTLDLPFSRPVRLFRDGSRVTPYEFFSGPNRPTLERFISFAAAGPYRIT